MHRLPRFLLCSLTAVLPAFGLLMVVNSAASAQTTPQTQAAQAAAVARAAIKNLSVGQHATDQRTGASSRVGALTQVQSTNWSGYADTGSGFGTVTGHWTEPSASCGFATSLAAFWVGIDGYSSGSVEQDGTLIECYLGRAYQFTWWEMYPTNSIQTVGSSLAAGDSISASVVRSGSSYTLSVTDSTRPANSFTTRQSCSSCANSSAEWIAEAPSGSAGVYPLADFGTWNESGATVTEGSANGVISSFTDDEITMVDSSNNVKAQPGALNGGGNGFSVAWKRSS
jgi:Peptidase A4 family